MFNHASSARPRAAALLICSIAAGGLLVVSSAGAAIVATVPLATSANYAVLGGSTVTNTGASTLDGSLGLSPGSSVTGFPPGLVLAPGVTDVTNGAAGQAQSDLTLAYVNAAGRSIDATTTADLGNLELGAGVYAGPDHSALQLTGPLTLDGAGDPSSVFIFQTDSSLTTASSSSVNLINGAQECNVFWQVASSATLGTGSDFTGNILALTSITVTSNVTVHGRALARNGAVTLDDDTFVTPTCATDVGTTTTTAPAVTTTLPAVTTTVPDTTITTLPEATTTTVPETTTTFTSGERTTVPDVATTTVPGQTLSSLPTDTTSTVAAPAPPTTPQIPGTPIIGPPRTGGVTPVETFPWLTVIFLGLFLGNGTIAAVLTRRMRQLDSSGTGS